MSSVMEFEESTVEEAWKRRMNNNSSPRTCVITITPMRVIRVMRVIRAIRDMKAIRIGEVIRAIKPTRRNEIF